MSKNLRLSFLTALGIVSTGLVMAQADPYAYAITDVSPDGQKWLALRKINLSTGEYGRELFNGSSKDVLSYDAITSRPTKAMLQTNVLGELKDAAFGNSVAALAFDKANNRLYYTPMLLDQLRYIDLNTMKVYYLNSEKMTGATTYPSDQSNIITRMVIAADGYGYAISNDGNNVVRFSTDGSFEVKNLGPITDDMQADNISVHNSCTSYGGDIVADNAGNLFVFSARQHVFKVDIKTMRSVHLGRIEGLPAEFSVNGAAVDANNNIVLSSATYNKAIYKMDYKTLVAAPVEGGAAGWFTSDMANGNLLQTAASKPPVFVKGDVNVLQVDAAGTDGKISLYPNPAVDQFTLKLNVPEGRYSVKIQDAVGRNLKQTTLNVAGKGQVENIALPPSARKSGVYMVTVFNADLQAVYNQKLVVQ